MASRETQNKVLSVALQLFNDHGTGKVSTNRIAAAAGISKGNLNYHYARKADIILDLFAQMTGEIQNSWKNDHLSPTLEHLGIMFARELRLMWRYRFFYRELVQLLRDHPVLRERFALLRKRRVTDGKVFLDALVAQGYLRRLGHPDEFELLTTNTWLLTNHWLNFVETTSQMDADALRRGYTVMLSMIRPYATEKALQDVMMPADSALDLEIPTDR